MDDQSLHIVMLPSPGMGHLIPLAELAKRLTTLHNFSITLTLPTTNSSPPSKSIKSLLLSLPHPIQHTFLPPIDLDDIPQDDKIETRISLTVTRSLPSIRELLKTLLSTRRVVAFVVDIFGTDVFELAWEFKIKPYIFFTSTAMVLSHFKHFPTLHDSFPGQLRDLPEPISLPGCVPILGSQLMDPAQDKNNDAYKWLLHHTKRYKLADGLIVNTFTELEPGALKALGETSGEWPRVYPVGPLIRTGSAGSDHGSSETLKWLDEQPHGSVLFVSFGSGGTLSSKQINELALGLELSGQRFLWVVRSPSDTVANATYFSQNTMDDPLRFLPEGFVERTKGVGLVVPMWAPQIQVLSHGSTGGFLSHCGWNSVLESVVHGVALIAWPLYAEQKMNAVLVVDDLKAALRARVDDSGLVVREEVARVVKGLMEGEEGKRVRSRMREFKEGAELAWGENGSSSNSLAELAQKWKNNNQVKNVDVNADALVN